MRRLAVVVLPAVLAAESAVAAEGGGANLLIQPKFGTMFWTVVIFLGVWYILAKFAWKPLLGAVEARERGIRDDIDNARKEREASQRLLDEHKALVAQAHKERSDAVEAGRRDAERLKAEILDEARIQRDQLMKQAEARIDAGLRHARAELKGEAADLAIQAAGKLLAKNLDDATQRRLVEDYLSDLERLGSDPNSRPN